MQDDTSVESKAPQTNSQYNIRLRMSRLQKEYSSLSLELRALSSNTIHLKEKYSVELKELQIEINQKNKYLKLAKQQQRGTDSKTTQDESAETEMLLQRELKEMVKKKRRLKRRLKGVGKRGRKIKLFTVLDCYHSVLERRRKRREYYKRHRK